MAEYPLVKPNCHNNEQGINMNRNERINYDRIEVAIKYIQQHFKQQPSLEKISKVVGISPFHFQRMFSDWAGVSPKKFMQYLSVEYAKSLLNSQPISLLDAAYETGLSGTSRLHDLFVKIEGMTPGEFKNGGESLVINYGFFESPFGKIIVASTGKGICHMVFEEDEQKAIYDLNLQFPNAEYKEKLDESQKRALHIFSDNWERLDKVKLHLKGTNFQLKVWETLLKVPQGNLSTYGDLAKAIKKPKASRAVGTAVGKNPVAILIPCHRVIQANGNIGRYMWGKTRKSAIIGWEASKGSL